MQLDPQIEARRETREFREKPNSLKWMQMPAMTEDDCGPK